MEVKLVVALGKSAGKEVRVVGPRFLIGRAGDCHLRPRNELVSRRHCEICVENGLVAVRDLGSKNGTFVNGERIQGERELNNGDRLNICDLEFEVQLVVSAQGEGKPEVASVQETAAETAPADVDDEELDLDRWLRQTQTADAAQTERPETESQSPEEAEEEKKQQKPSDVVGVWKEGRWKPTSANPRDAAADTLKNFFNRR
jgi:pSer/pThr/pTyr-binding forkhead associated (FHA) protein